MAKTRRVSRAGNRAGAGVAELEQALSEERRARRALVEASVRLNSLLSLPDLLTATMQAAADLMNAETSSR